MDSFFSQFLQNCTLQLHTGYRHAKEAWCKIDIQMLLYCMPDVKVYLKVQKLLGVHT
jgi:hypothetical protein